MNEQEQGSNRFEKAGQVMKTGFYVFLGLFVFGFWITLPPGFQVISIMLAGLVALKVYKSRKTTPQTTGQDVAVRDEAEVPQPQ